MWSNKELLAAGVFALLGLAAVLIPGVLLPFEYIRRNGIPRFETEWRPLGSDIMPMRESRNDILHVEDGGEVDISVFFDTLGYADGANFKLVCESESVNAEVSGNLAPGINAYYDDTGIWFDSEVTNETVIQRFTIEKEDPVSGGITPTVRIFEISDGIDNISNISIDETNAKEIGKNILNIEIQD